MIVVIIQFLSLIVGSFLIGYETSWQLGLGVGCITYTVMPFVHIGK